VAALTLKLVCDIEDAKSQKNSGRGTKNMHRRSGKCNPGTRASASLRTRSCVIDSYSQFTESRCFPTFRKCFTMTVSLKFSAAETSKTKHFGN
jgi:hypothetical protein